MLNKPLSRKLLLSVAALCAAFAPAGMVLATDKAVNLDGNTTNESVVSTNVVTTYPVKIKNKVTNKVVGQAFRFQWPSAGPGGFASTAGNSTKPGTSTGVGAVWTWETTQQVFSFTGNQCTNDICFTRTYPTTSTSQIGPFGVPGRSLSANGVTVTSESLTASLLTFFSPETQLFSITSSVEQLSSGLFRYTTTYTNNGTDPIVITESDSPVGCNSFCGDGQARGVEDCDGDDLRGNDCVQIGLGGTGLACHSDCTYNTDACSPPSCGNGVREGDEQCDGSDFGGSSCYLYGGTGDPSCTANCTIDLSTCDDVCGNGRVDPTEQCEGTDTGGATCGDFGKGAYGTLGCTPNCQFDPTTCIDVCGNGVAEYYNGEDCDGSDLQGNTCLSRSKGSLTGYLNCAPNCYFDISECTCGDGAVTGWEDCDGENLGDYTCSDLGGTGGTLACSGCYFDVTGCTGICGNGVVDPGEECDGGNLNDASCQDFGGSGGTLACNYDCTYSLKNCNDVCGNGVIDPGEECDGSDLANCDCSGCDGGSAKAAVATSASALSKGQVAALAAAGSSMASPAEAHAVPLAAAGGRNIASRAGRPAKGSLVRIGIDGKKGLQIASAADRHDRSGTMTLAPLAPDNKNFLQCDSLCRFDRSDCNLACDKLGGTTTILGNRSTTTCEVAIHPAKEVTGQVTVCGPGIPQGDPLCNGSDPASQGPANKLVPDESITITGPYLVANQVQVLDGGDGVAQPSETVQLLVYLSNAGPVGVRFVHATLVADDIDVDSDGTPDHITIVQGESDYPNGPCMAGVSGGGGDCLSPASPIPSCANVTPFVVTFPAAHPEDVSRTLRLIVTGVPGGGLAERGGSDGADTRTAGLGSSTFPTVLFTVGIGSPVCGDGALQLGEQCDDGNLVNGDCCSSACQYENGGCEDGNICTVGDTCRLGVCGAGPLNTCNDGNPCTDDACSPTAPGNGCTHTNNTNPCDLCAMNALDTACLSVGGGVCSGGVCVPAARSCPVVNIEADTMVKKSSASSNYGKKDEIEADKPTSDIHTLIKVRVAGTSGQSISHATLKLFASSNSNSGGRIHQAACNWTETGVTWRTQPTFNAAVIDTKGAVVKNQPVLFDLTSALQNDPDGTYCFLIDNVAGNADYYSREASAGRPSASVTTSVPCVPVATGIQADATVVSNTPTTNYGSDPTIGVDASPIKQTFFRVTVSGVGTRAVTSARLRLMIANISGSDADKGGNIKLVPTGQCGGWNESTITYQTRPLGAGSSLSSISAVKAGQLVEFDLKTTIPGDGTYCYRLESSSTNGADYNSKEGAALRPELVLTVAP